MNGFLAKPVDIDILFATLLKWLRVRQVAMQQPLPRGAAGSSGK